MNGDTAETPMDQYDSLLMEYACGVLDESLAILMASHLTLSAPARQRLSLYEELGGALICGECPPVAMNQGSLETVLGHLDCPETEARCAQQHEHIRLMDCTDLPQALCRHLKSCHVKPLRWRPVFPGIAAIDLSPPDAEKRITLMKAKPGAKSPLHSHKFREITLVLHGAYTDGDLTFSRGDLAIMEAGTSHKPVASKTEGCVCLVVTRERFGAADWARALIATMLGRA